jgi:hypothetical protein
VIENGHAELYASIVTAAGALLAPILSNRQQLRRLERSVKQLRKQVRGMKKERHGITVSRPDSTRRD